MQMLQVQDPRSAECLVRVAGEWSVWFKPPGLLAVPDRDGDAPTLLDAARVVGIASPRTIGRLDRAACGLMLLAESSAAQRRFTAAWARADAVREYEALVLAPPPPNCDTIDLPVGPGRRGAMRVGTGRPARTHLRRIEDWMGRPRLRLRLETGRRHQIRVHLAAVGAPIVGDRRYRRLACRVGGFSGGDLRPAPAAAIALCCRRLALPSPEVDVALAPGTMTRIWDTVIALAGPDSVQS